MVRGYLKFKVGQKIIKAHCIAWALHYGEWPKQEIDHINRVKNDNRIVNLRDVSHTENMRNRGPWKRKDSAIDS